VGRIYQQTFIDTYSKSAINAADLLNDRVIPFFDAQGVRHNRILTDRGTESVLDLGRGKPQNHAYQLYLAVEDIDHSRTKANHPQTNGICERFHKTLQDECYSLLFRKELYRSLEELRVDPGRLAGELQPGATPLRPVLLREDSLGDLPDQQAAGVSQRPEPGR
jgi:transposase InsO family protein